MPESPSQPYRPGRQLGYEDNHDRHCLRLRGVDALIKPPVVQRRVYGSDPAEADRVFKALAYGGTVTMPLDEIFWALCFGRLVDRFGTPWTINCSRPEDEDLTPMGHRASCRDPEGHLCSFGSGNPRTAQA